MRDKEKDIGRPGSATGYSLNVPRVIVTGKIATFIENHKGIIEYNSSS